LIQIHIPGSNLLLFLRGSKAPVSVIAYDPPLATYAFYISGRVGFE
jgi:hypothetical protein